MSSIKINTGVKTYDLEDENGNVLGQIHINPGDLSLYERANKARHNILDYVSKLNDINTDELSDEAMYSMLNDLDVTIRNEIDNLVGAGVSDMVFKGSCLNTVNGITAVENFLSAIIPIIQHEVSEEAKKSEKRMSKYLDDIK